MGKLLPVIVVVFALMTASQACKNPTESSDSFDHEVITPKVYQDTRSALAELKLTPDQVESDDEIGAALDRARRAGGKYKIIYETLQSGWTFGVRSGTGERASDYSGSPTQAVEYLVAVFAQTDTKMKPFMRYLQRYWSRVFEEFVLHRVSSIEYFQQLVNSKLFNSLDRFFRAAMGIEKGTMDNGDYYERLKEFNLAKSKLNVDSLMGAADESYFFMRIKSKSQDEQLTQLEQFLDNKCYPEFHVHSRSFNLVALGQIFNVSRYCDVKILILTEYHRACLAWLDDEEKEKILENVKNQIAHQQKPIKQD